MKSDFTRWTFRAARHYAGVLLQQGRVSLDADWNEQGAIERHQQRMLARDLIGPCGGPKGAAGFDVTVGETGRELLIGAGRYYVDGLLVENEQPCAFDSQPDLPSAAGILANAADAPRRYLVYLDVWERLITPLDDPTLLEPALGGPDTSVRLKTVWQVRLSPRGKARKAGWPGSADGDEASQATLHVRTADSGYVGAGNRLYRVEIHAAGGQGPESATFKWSRDNGSFALAVQKVDGRKIGVASSREDIAQRLMSGHWLELTDDTLELDGLPGQLVQVKSIDAQASTITVTTAADPLADTDDGVDPARHPKVRAWDGVGKTGEGAESGWSELEDGIEVSFGDGVNRTGDYWLFPARTASQEVEWPDGPQPPDRIEHRCCPLAVVDLGNRRKRWRVIEDRRRIFAPLGRAG